jgi:tryptophan synthase alpha subunit
MERGVGGRIEAAFEAAKEKGEAAFVTFITAGYPTSQGTYSISQQDVAIEKRLFDEFLTL